MTEPGLPGMRQRAAGLPAARSRSGHAAYRSASAIQFASGSSGR
jgi:hypothetical protein